MLTQVAAVASPGYPYKQWVGHFYQVMDYDRFVQLGLAAARLGLRIYYIVSRDLECALLVY